MTRRPVPLARLEGLLASERGLTAAEVSERRQRYGVNDIVETPPSRWWDLARDTLEDPMIWFLAGVERALRRARRGRARRSSCSRPSCRWSAWTPSSTAARRPRRRASRAASPSAPPSSATACPWRSRPSSWCPATWPSSLPGEAFPADGIIVGGDELQADESSLTGEAYPVAKRPLPGAAGGRRGAARRRIALGVCRARAC